MKKVISLILFTVFTSTVFASNRSFTDTAKTKKILSAALHVPAILAKSLRSLFGINQADTISSAVTKTIISLNDTSLVLAEDIPMPVNELSVFENELYHKRLDTLQKEIPLSYNEFVQSYINLYAYHRRALVERLLGEGSYYFPIFEKALKTEGVPEQLKYLPIIESQLNPFALSRVGASGLWQFMYTTGKGYGLQINSYLDERLDPVKASLAAARYFKDSYERYGDWLLVIASYNCGTGNVDRAIKRSGGAHDFWTIKRFLPKETRSYVPAFIAATYIFSYARHHGLRAQKPIFSVQNDSVLVNNKLALNTIATVLNINPDDLRKLNPQYRRGIVTGTADDQLAIIMPRDKKKMFLAMRDKLNDQPDNLNMTQVGYSTTEIQHSVHSTIVHKVRRGETLAMIALHYDVTVQDLRVWNQLHHLSIDKGQHIKIKTSHYSQSGTTITRHSRHSRKNMANYYKVRRGDTLSIIAKRFNIPLTILRNANRGHLSSLRAGQTLKV